MDRIKPLFTATATAIGGRNGHTESSDGIVKADLSVPKAMGGYGKPGTATPSASSPPVTRPASAARSISSPSARSATRAAPASPAPSPSVRATAAASASR